MRREADIRREGDPFVSVTHQGAAARAKMGRLPPCSTVYRSMGDRFDRTHTDGDVDFRHAAHLTFCSIVVSLSQSAGFVKSQPESMQKILHSVMEDFSISPGADAVCPTAARQEQRLRGIRVQT